MFTLRCTKKLLARLNASPVAEDLSPSTRLGDWYANLLYKPGGQIVLVVSERTLLPVLVHASPASTLVARFQTAAVDLLLRLGVPAALAEDERKEMEQAHIGRTASRQVLGSMNDFAYVMGGYLEKGLSLEDASEKLAHAPCSPIGMMVPSDVVRKVFVGGTENE